MNQPIRSYKILVLTMRDKKISFVELIGKKTLFCLFFWNGYRWNLLVNDCGGWRSQIRKICSNLKMTKNVKKDQICTFFSQKWQKYAKLTKRLLFRKVFNSDNCFYHNPRDTTNQNNQFSNTKIWISNLHLKCRFCVSEN